MQKCVNILEISNLFKDNLLLCEQVKTFLQLQRFKKHEMQSLYDLCQEFLKIDNQCFDIFEGYYIGYRIPQIGKEFDLIRFEKDRIINIELKSGLTDEPKILKQLERNYYYLSALQREKHHYVFVSSERKFYYYSQGALQEIQAQTLYQTLKNPQIEQISPDVLFAPVNYLISPFNNTKLFIQNEYFLTGYQEEIYKKILDGINTKTQDIFSISGQAGTGKTLLIYHIVKNLIKQQYQVAIVHCASLNDGINKLKQLKWHIYTIKEFNIEQVKADVIVIDESQRISIGQLQQILRGKENKILIFSHDVYQQT